MSNNALLVNNPMAELKPVKKTRRYTLAEFLERAENSNDLLEYYNGTITKLPMARGPHNEIIMNVGTALNISIKNQGKKFRVFGGQQKVYLPALNIGIVPDVLVITEEPLYWDENKVLLINPILIVEVLSKGTKKYDRTSKFSEYKTLESFKEYVLIDQKRCYIETYYKDQPNTWIGRDYMDMSNTIDLKSIGCNISVADIYENISF